MRCFMGAQGVGGLRGCGRSPALETTITRETRIPSSRVSILRPSTTRKRTRDAIRYHDSVKSSKWALSRSGCLSVFIFSYLAGVGVHEGDEGIPKNKLLDLATGTLITA